MNFNGFLGFQCPSDILFAPEKAHVCLKLMFLPAGDCGC